MMSSRIGFEDAFLDAVSMYCGRNVDRAWMSLGIVGVWTVCTSEKVQNEEERRGWASRICCSRDVWRWEAMVM